MNQDSLVLQFVESLRDRYLAEVESLQEILRKEVPASGDLTSAVRSLFLHQVQTGVVLDDLHDVQRFQLLDPEHSSRAFYFVLNPRRAERHRGGGRTSPPTGWEAHRNNCFLCRENVIWQQRFCQYPFRIDLPSGPFQAWVNPFPLGRWHLTIAADEHRPQAWLAQERQETINNLAARLADLADLASRLPRFLVFENGEGAGASIPGHHHYQALCRWPGLARFPIEEAATRQIGNGAEAPFVLADYPVRALVCRGSLAEVNAQARLSLEHWIGGVAPWDHLTANLLATRESAGSDGIFLFIIPRNHFINRSHGMDSHVASLELAGEIVRSDPGAQRRIEEGEIGYRSIWDTLASCQDLGSRSLLERFGAKLPALGAPEHMT